MSSPPLCPNGMHRTTSALPVTTVRPSNTHLLTKFKITKILRFWIMAINENEAEVTTVSSMMIACN